MAAIWRGSPAFGLVNIPVELRTAVREDHISFRMLREDDMSAIKYERVAESDCKPVPWSEIVKGYEYDRRRKPLLRGKRRQHVRAREKPLNLKLGC